MGEDGVVDEELRKVYTMHCSNILAGHHQGQVQSTFNYPLANDLDLNQLMERVREIYQSQRFAKG